MLLRIVHSYFCASHLVSSGPDLSGHHGFFGAYWGHEVLLTEEIQRELDQEASNLHQQLLSFHRVLFIKTWFEWEAHELLFVPHQTWGQTPENLQCHHINSPQLYLLLTLYFEIQNRWEINFIMIMTFFWQL